ncbi:transcription elongation factor B polypeptide 3 [Monomorium pharaonis]|uniref:transcription elongation factor B polypeptide 3 n=1 Tax=Monomorium pharaonis TaxID=307658 RepID=UPI00063F7E33|nr:transcription elongation factor B polypeptide 3 [Monomorium pharaonis]
MSIIDKISYYQRNLENCGDDEDRILHYISKLYKLPVTVQHLQQTGVGRTVNGFRKYCGTVGDAAKSLVCKWKIMVVDTTEDSSDREDEDEALVIDAHEDCTGTPESPKLEDIEEGDSSSNQSSESKYVHKYEKIKSELSTKHSVVHLSKSKSEEKQEMHEKSRHSSKHSHSERRSKESKSSKSTVTKETHSSSTKHSHNKDDLKKTKATEINEDNNKKRKTTDSTSLPKENKKRKLSDSKSDDEKPQLSISEHNRSQLKSSGIQIEVKIKVEDEQFLASDNKQDVKQEKYLQGKSKSSKLKSQESDSKAKGSSEKQKHNKEHTSHKKHDTKRSSSHHSSKEISKVSSSKVSSSSSKDYIKSKDKDKRKEHKEDKNKHEKKKETKIKLMQDINGDKGIDCNSGASFAEALGMCSMPQPTKKRQSNSSNMNSSKLIKTEQLSSPVDNRKILTVKSEPECGDDTNPPSLLAPNVKLEPLSVDLASTLPEISPNYKPLPYINPVQRKEEIKPVDDIIYVKNQRTKVYSGNKVGYTTVPTLYEMCIRVLIENIDALEFTGGVPYDILKPILERATPDQLFMLEHHNPYLIEDTDILWKYHCNREFRNNERQEMESWREMYMRCLDEREAKLKTLTANIKQSIDKSIPVRSAKLAYVDNVVKPPRNVLKKQAKYGTANAIPATVSSVKKKLVSGGATNNATNIAVPPPPMSRFKASTSNMKKTKAPLMAKALQLIKGRYKR